MTDLKAARGEIGSELGPIGQAVKHQDYNTLLLLSDHEKAEEKNYATWLQKHSKARIEITHCQLTSPTEFREIYNVATSALKKLRTETSPQELACTYHLSPGTPAMAAIWILLSKTSFPAKLIESSAKAGVKVVSLPFEIAADFLPDIAHPLDDDIVRLGQGLPPEAPAFSQIIHRCTAMKRVIARARRVALHEVPVLIQGESGTGKELIARAIHAESTRKSKPFIAVNCGAIPLELFESELFGYEKGAFTGATQPRPGLIEAANGGTLFLDELGDLPLKAQVKLLRVLQEGEIIRLGSNKAIAVDFRLIAATNRVLLEDVTAGKFREDLFHRIAIGVLEMPPLRDRGGDLNALIDFALLAVNKTAGKQEGWQDKKLSAGARNLLHQHPWPGNVRELLNTLSRAVIWATGDTISADEMREAIFPISGGRADTQKILNRNLGNGLSLPELIEEVAQHYLNRAMVEANGNKTEAATLVGLPSYQTLTNWLRKYGVE